MQLNNYFCSQTNACALETLGFEMCLPTIPGLRVNDLIFCEELQTNENKLRKMKTKTINRIRVRNELQNYLIITYFD